MTTPNNSEEIVAEDVQQNGECDTVEGKAAVNGGGKETTTDLEADNGTTNAGGVAVNESEDQMTTESGAEKEGSVTTEKEEAAANGGGETTATDADARALGTKTPPASEQRQTPPHSANTRASTRKRRTAAPIFQNSGTKPKRSNTTSNKTVNLASSSDDPFNFSTQSDIHPEPLKNISIERSSFNEVKFTKSLPSSADRYANMEKMAASRNPQLAASLSSQPSNSRDSLSQLSSMTNTSLRLDLTCTSESGSTPKSSGGQRVTITNITKVALSGARGASGRKRRSNASTATPRSATRAKRAPRTRAAADSGEEDDEEGQQTEEEEEGEDDSFRMDVDNDGGDQHKGTPGRKKTTMDEAEDTTKTPAHAVAGDLPTKTPERGSARRSAAGIESARKAAEEQKLKEEALYAVPALAPEEQLAVDCPQETHLFMGTGARVLALWGNDYYAANICGREALGRYYVHFVEDNLNRILPPTGVVPLSALKMGTRVSFIDSVDDEEMGKTGDVVEQPATDNPNGWARGEFMVRELVDDEATPTGETKSVPWAKLFLNKEQARHLLQQQKQQKTPTAPGHRTSQKLNPVLEVDQENIISDARSFRRSRSAALARMSTSASSTAAALPAAAGSSDVDNNNTSLETIFTPPRTPRRAKQSEQPTTPPKLNLSPEVAVDDAVQTAATTTGSGGGDDGGSARTSAIRRRGSRTSPRLAPAVAMVEKNDDADSEQQQADNVVQEEQSEKTASEQDMKSDETTTTMHNGSSTKEEQQQKLGEDGEEGQAKGVKSMQQQKQQRQSDDEKRQEIVVVVGQRDDVDDSSNGGGGEQLHPTATATVIVETERETAVVVQQQKLEEKVEKPMTTSAAEQQASATTAKHVVVPESAIFAGLKFVLTSATRPNKKVTDFNKRDYRKKIEERGGQIIDDFTQPLTSSEETAAFLIADTYYRTHKYLSALSLSIPCVSYTWIQQCVAERKFNDHRSFLLPAGESSLDPKQQFDWKPLKGVLMAGKRVLICSNTTESDPGIVSFAEIWTPILQNLGAILIGTGQGEPFGPKSAASLEEKLAFCAKVEPPVDVLLAETDCQVEVAKAVEERNGLAVSSEWVIQAIVTGSLPDLKAPGGEKFRYDCV